jgi:hypothetical protein
MECEFMLDDGRWHDAKQILKAVRQHVPEANLGMIESRLESLRWAPPTDRALEIRQRGDVNQYRLRKFNPAREEALQAVEKLLEGVAPIIDQLKGMSPVANRDLAAQLEKLFEPFLPEQQRKRK